MSVEPIWIGHDERISSLYGALKEECLARGHNIPLASVIGVLVLLQHDLLKGQMNA